MGNHLVYNHSQIAINVYLKPGLRIYIKRKVNRRYQTSQLPNLLTKEMIADPCCMQKRAGVEAAGCRSWLEELSPVLLLVNQVTFLHTLDRVLDCCLYCLIEDTALDFLKNRVNAVMKCVMVSCVPKITIQKMSLLKSDKVSIFVQTVLGRHHVATAVHSLHHQVSNTIC